MNNNLLKNIGIDISNIPDQSVEILIGCEPKVKCRNKFLQKIFTKVFGLKPVYETKQAKVITVKAEDYPKNLDGNLEITFGENVVMMILPKRLEHLLNLIIKRIHQQQRKLQKC